MIEDYIISVLCNILPLLLNDATEYKMKITCSLKNVLDNPIIYSYAMKILGSGKNKPTFINDFIKPKSGNKILDFGCGPATILDYLPHDIVYTGVDFNASCIESAREKYGSRGTFIVCDVADENNKPFVGKFDIVLAQGLIHHLASEDASFFLKNAFDCLKKNGRLITLDNVYSDELSFINKIALKLDRGKYIRNKADYLSLFSQFSQVQCTVLKSQLRIPYYHIICEVTM